MISRLLQGRGEPRSIFEHIDSHIRPGADGLAEGGEVLPDEEHATRDDPDAGLGADGPIAPGERDYEAVGQIYRALSQLARKSSQANRRRLRELFREGRVRVRIDPLRDRLSAESPPSAVQLYPELRELLLGSGHRDEVKYAIALMAGFGRREDADLFRILGRHEQFTLYAAIALASVADDPVEEWLGLLPHASERGRTELSELILREPRSQAVRERLVRAGVGEGNALQLARGCRLDELLAPAEIDEALLAGAREIMDTLIWQWDWPAALIDYEAAGLALEQLVRQIGRRRPKLAEYLTLSDLPRQLLEPVDAAALAACGLDPERCERILAAAAALLARDHWQADAEAALASADAHERWVGLQVAASLGLELGDYLAERLRADPLDAQSWRPYVADADEARMRDALEIALERWDMAELARGAALEVEVDWHGLDASASALLGELERFPGLAAPLLAAALESPIIGLRLHALAALRGWDHVPADLLELVARARAGDPDEHVREQAGRVLSGEG